MPVSTTSVFHFSPGGPASGPPPGVPGPPTAVTSVTRDGGATVSFLAPASQGTSSITAYVVTPYAGASAQASTTVPAGSLTQITGSDTSTYQQAQVTGLTNGTAYTFTVKARNSSGDSTESAASGANTPLAGLVFGDNFNGPASGPIDPEWWVYDRCGYLAQSEVQYYRPDHCVLDGTGNLKITAEHLSYTGPGYPSGGGGSVTQPWRSGAVQSNTRLYVPAAGNTMTFEIRMQTCDGAGSGYWPAFWLEGQDYLTAWKTDPLQSGWTATGKAEIDIVEYYPGSTSNSHYLTNVYTGGPGFQAGADGNFSAAMHTSQARWKPGVSVSFWLDGTQTSSTTSIVPASGAQFFLMFYMQMLTGGSTATQSCLIDWVRVFDQNLG